MIRAEVEVGQFRCVERVVEQIGYRTEEIALQIDGDQRVTGLGEELVGKVLEIVRGEFQALQLSEGLKWMVRRLERREIAILQREFDQLIVQTLEDRLR